MSLLILVAFFFVILCKVARILLNHNYWYYTHGMHERYFLFYVTWQKIKGTKKMLKTEHRHKLPITYHAEHPHELPITNHVQYSSIERIESRRRSNFVWLHNQKNIFPHHPHIYAPSSFSGEPKWRKTVRWKFSSRRGI